MQSWNDSLIYASGPLFGEVIGANPKPLIHSFYHDSILFSFVPLL